MEFIKKYRPELAFIALSLFIGGIGGLLTGLGMPIYKVMEKPWFTPPAWVFPVVWTVLYVLMGIGMGRVWQRSDRVSLCLLLFTVQLLMNLLWTLWFFILQLYGFSLVWLVALLAVVAAMAICFARTDPTAAWLQLPYVLWLLLAAALNFGVWMMNR